MSRVAIEVVRVFPLYIYTQHYWIIIMEIQAHFGKPRSAYFMVHDNGELCTKYGWDEITTKLFTCRSKVWWIFLSKSMAFDRLPLEFIIKQQATPLPTAVRSEAILYYSMPPSVIPNIGNFCDLGPVSLQCCHIECDGVSNHRRLDCFIKRLVCGGANQRKHQSSTSLAIVRRIHRRWPEVY